MAFLLGDFSNALHNILLPYIRDNFPRQTILLDQMKRNSGVTFLNNTFYAPVRSTRHGGVTNLANDGNLTVSGTAGLAQAQVSAKRMTGAFDISKMAIDATKSNTSAVENALTFQADALMSDFARSANRQLFNDGAGVIAEQQGSTAATTISVTNVGSSSGTNDGRVYDRYGTGFINGDISPVKYLAPLMIITAGTGATTYGTVSSVSFGAGGTIGTITMTSTLAATFASAGCPQPVYLLDGSQAGAGTMEITGLKRALASDSTGTYASVARSVTGWAPQFGSASEALTLDRMEQSFISAREYSQVGDTYAIFLNKTLYRKYGAILTAMRRTVDEAELLGGWKGLSFAAGAGEVGVFLDFDTPDGEMFVLDLDSLTICQISDLDWLEDPNGGGLLRLSNKIQYQAEMAWFPEMICLAPAANGHETQKTA